MSISNNTNFENSSQLENLYGIACDTSVSVIVEGMHGIGKSESVYSFAKKNDFHVEPLFLSHQEVADLIGIPTMEKGDQGEALTTWSKPIWLKRLEDAAADGKRCVLFLDELNRSQTEVRQAALQLVLDKQIHEHRLPKTEVNGQYFDTFVIAAINPADEDYQVDELDPALMDRFLHYKLSVNATSWLEWATENKVHPVIVKYISNHKDQLYAKDENSKLYPTPRSWTKLSEILYSYENKNIDNKALLNNLITGKIGPVIGAKFMTYYLENNNIVSMDDIIEASEAAFKKYKKKDKDDLKAVKKVAEKDIEPMIKDLEVPVLKDITTNIMDKFIYKPKEDEDERDRKLEFEEIYPVICYLHALPVEQLTSVIKQLQLDSEENNHKKYTQLSDVDPNREIFRKVVARMTKLKLD